MHVVLPFIKYSCSVLDGFRIVQDSSVRRRLLLLCSMTDLSNKTQKNSKWEIISPAPNSWGKTL